MTFLLLSPCRFEYLPRGLLSLASVQLPFFFWNRCIAGFSKMFLSAHPWKSSICWNVRQPKRKFAIMQSFVNVRQWLNVTILECNCCERFGKQQNWKLVVKCSSLSHNCKTGHLKPLTESKLLRNAQKLTCLTVWRDCIKLTRIYISSWVKWEFFRGKKKCKFKFSCLVPAAIFVFNIDKNFTKRFR